MEKVPFISINGSKGKSSTVKYVSYIANQLYNLNVLTYEYDNHKNLISNITINNTTEIDIQKIRDEIIFDIYVDSEAELLNQVIKQNKINLVVCKFNKLTKFFNVIACGLTTIELHESQNIEYTLQNLLTDKTFGNEFISSGIPLIMCNHEKEITSALVDLCDLLKIPLFITNHYHLKYIDIDTGIKSKYSYINLALSLAIVNYLSKCLNLNTHIINLDNLQVKLFDPDDHKPTTYNDKKVYIGMYTQIIPKLETIKFDDTYSTILEKYSNLNFYIDSAGSFKSSNLLIDWIQDKENKNTNDVLLCIFSSNTNIDLIKTLLPLTSINFETFMIADYELKGRNSEDIFKSFDVLDKEYDPEKYKFPENSNWIETVYNTINIFYNDEIFKFSRRKASIPLNHYADLAELHNMKDEEIEKINLPEKSPNIIVDNTESILQYIKNLAKTNTTVNYKVLVTGSKTLCKDIVNAIT